MKKLYIFIILYAIIALFVFSTKTNNIKEKMTIPVTDYVNIGCYNDTDMLMRYDKPVLSNNPRALSMIYVTNNNTPIATTSIVQWPPTGSNVAKMVTNINDAKQIASDNGYSVFGIQAGGFLFLGMDSILATQYGVATTCLINDAGINTSGWTNDIWCSIPKPNISDYVNIGCYMDDTGISRAIPVLQAIQLATSVDYAKQTAVNSRAPIFGLQYGGQLFFGTDLLKATTSTDQATDNSCLAGSGLGIGNQNSVWVNRTLLSDADKLLYDDIILNAPALIMPPLDIPMPNISDYENIGCFNDNPLLTDNTRAFSMIYTTNGIVQWSQSNLSNAIMVKTIAEALQIAADNSYPVFGIQEGVLFLSNDNIRATQYGKTTTCSINANGINTTGWTNNIWFNKKLLTELSTEQDTGTIDKDAEMEDSNKSDSERKRNRMERRRNKRVKAKRIRDEIKLKKSANKSKRDTEKNERSEKNKKKNERSENSN